MIKDQFDNVSISENELIGLLYSKDKVNLELIYLDNPDEVDKFNSANIKNYTDLSNLKTLPNLNLSLEEFDNVNQNNWFMPAEYKNLDIEQFILDQCKTNIELERITQELELFKKHSMLNVLRYLKFLVDTLRNNKIVWGVGRGSSVSSYCLYILGVHKVNSIKYSLNINEFLK